MTNPLISAQRKAELKQILDDIDYTLKENIHLKRYVGSANDHGKVYILDLNQNYSCYLKVLDLIRVLKSKKESSFCVRCL